MGITEQGGKVAVSVVDSMKSVPLAIALLVVNVGFLAFAAYLLGQVAANAAARQKDQVELIAKLTDKLVDCGSKTSRNEPGKQ